MLSSEIDNTDRESWSISKFVFKNAKWVNRINLKVVKARNNIGFCEVA